MFYVHTCMSKASCVEHKKLLLCVCCIIVVVITATKGTIRCKMIQEWDQNYITVFLFAVETANYFLQQNSTKLPPTHPEPPRAPAVIGRESELWVGGWEHVAALTCESRAFGRAVALPRTAGLECWVSSSAQGPLSAQSGELLTDE